MGVKKSGGVVHCIAHCSECGEQWTEYTSTQDKVRKHVEATGHKVHMEVGSAYTYEKA